MSKLPIGGILCLILSFSTISHGMDYIPKVFKSPRFLAMLATATVVSGTIYCIEYWQEGPNRQLYQAVLKNDVNAVREALYDGADHTRRTESGKTLLHFAVQKGYHDIACVLACVPNGRSDILNTEDKLGNTPLFYAIKNNDTKMFKLLRRAGANRYCTRDESDELQKVVDAMDLL